LQAEAFFEETCVEKKDTICEEEDMSWKPFMPVRLVFVPGMSSSSWVWNGGYQERQGSALRHQQRGRTTSTLQANLCTDFVNISCDKSQKMATPNYFTRKAL